MPQTQRNDYQVAIPGLEYGNGTDEYNFTGLAETNIGYGLAVTLGAATNLSNGRKPVKAGADSKFLGVSLIDRCGYDDTYQTKDAVVVKQKGRCYVKTSVAVTTSSPVFYRTDAGFEGQFTNVATGNQPVTRARFLGNFAAGFALLEFEAPITP